MDITYTVETITSWKDERDDPDIMPTGSGFYLLFAPHLNQKWYAGVSESIRVRMNGRCTALHHVGIPEDTMANYYIATISCNCVDQVQGINLNINTANNLGRGFYIVEPSYVPGGADDPVNLENVLIICADNELVANQDQSLRNIDLPNTIIAPISGFNIQLVMGPNAQAPNGVNFPLFNRQLNAGDLLEIQA